MNTAKGKVSIVLTDDKTDDKKIIKEGLNQVVNTHYYRFCNLPLSIQTNRYFNNEVRSKNQCYDIKRELRMFRLVTGSQVNYEHNYIHQNKKQTK